MLKYLYLVGAWWCLTIITGLSCSFMHDGTPFYLMAWLYAGAGSALIPGLLSVAVYFVTKFEEAD